MNSERMVFGAGCFWAIEFAFSKLKGVIKTTVGFMGGNTSNPSYEQVCSDKTGHTEVVLVEFNPKKISFESLLTEFWKMHNPTQLNRQGPDIGVQYRSVIFYFNEKQKKAAEKSLKEHQKKFKEKIVTAIEPAKEFFEAEEYHQKYYEKNNFKSCHI